MSSFIGLRFLWRQGGPPGINSPHTLHERVDPPNIDRFFFLIEYKWSYAGAELKNEEVD